MTIGEKIQFYRKRSGLSQEELGNKLLISRQTVSLWEMDKTVPTVDNLIRLKEIFNVSVDELLNSEEIPQATSENNNDIPNESYKFEFTFKEAKQAISPHFRFFYVLAALVGLEELICFIFTFDEKTSNDFIAIFLLSAIFIFPAIITALIVLGRVATKTVAKELSLKEYHYEIFNDHIKVDVYKNSNLIKSFFIDYNDIEKVKYRKNYISFKFNGQLFFAKRNTLMSESHFQSVTLEKSASNQGKSKKILISIFSIILVLLSLASILIANDIENLLYSKNHATFSNNWVFFPVALIPASSVAFGIVLLIKKRKNGIKNIVVGIIMSIILCLFGLTYFASNESNDDTLYIKVQEATGVDLPEYSHVVYQKDSNRAFVYLDERVAEEFEDTMKNEPLWLNEVPSSMVGILPTKYFSNASTIKNCIICNLDDKSINTLPSSSGTYNYIFIIYNATSDYFIIIEYEIEYTK